MTPDCYEVIDRGIVVELAVDWVTGSSVITEAAEDGAFIRDAMIYDRLG